jgi:hypothetical protein
MGEGTLVLTYLGFFLFTLFLDLFFFFDGLVTGSWKVEISVESGYVRNNFQVQY